MKIIGVDPGSEATAFCTTDSYVVVDADKLGNDSFINYLKTVDVECVVVESIQSYGMAVGRSVFDTCYMVGRIIQVCKDRNLQVRLVARPEYTRRICGVGKVNDSILRQALLLRFGGDGKNEPLNKLKGNSDKRSAYAVAVYHLDTQAA